jgi:hypothetical protein
MIELVPWIYWIEMLPVVKLNLQLTKTQKKVARLIFFIPSANTLSV